MKFTMLGTLAAFLIALPAYAAREFDCPPAQEVQLPPNETAMSEDLLQKRKQAREADIARLRDRFMRSMAQAHAAGGAAQQAAR